MLLGRYARYGPALNSYDLWKFVALAMMTIDHIGAYIFIDELWWRVIGRCSMPIWLFLVGFAKPDRIRGEVVVVALFMALTQPFYYEPVFPLNILFTILLCQLAIGPIIRAGWIETQPLALWLTVTVMGMVSFPFMEFGLFALHFAIIGHMVSQGYSSWRHKLYVPLAFVSYLLVQSAKYPFDAVQWAALIIATCLIAIGLWRFTLRELDARPGPGGKLAMWVSRNSLYYYAGHRMALQLFWAWLILPESLRQWKWWVW